MIKLISDKVACYLCKDEDCKDNYGLYEYAVYIILSSLFHIATIIVLGLCFNLLVESLMFYFSFISIRKFAGGYHAKTPTKCYLFSVASSIIILYLINYLSNISSIYLTLTFLLLVMICAILIIIISPIDNDNKTMNYKEKKVYKKIVVINSICIFILSLFFICIDLMNIGCSMLCGIVLSLIVLLLRKIQINVK